MSVYEQLTLPTFDIANDLRAAQAYPIQAPVVYLNGVVSINDGNQGIFQWVAGNNDADDSLNTLKSNWLALGRWKRVPLNATNVSGIIAVANGGTGLNSLTSHNLLIGNGTAAATLLPPSATSGQPLIGQGAALDPAYGTLGIVGGGTGLAAVAQGDLLYGSATNALASLAKSAATHQFLSNTGATNNPAWSQPAISDLQNIGNGTLLGNNAGVAGSPLALTAAQALAVIGGAPALVPILTKSLSYTVTTADVVNGRVVIEANASGGPLTITFPIALGTAGSSPIADVIKTDTTSNIVTISDGTNAVDAIVTPATALGQIGGRRLIYSNGANLRVLPGAG